MSTCPARLTVFGKRVLQLPLALCVASFVLGATAGSYKLRIPPAPPYVTPPNANPAVSGAATGFFRLSKDASGRWWFIDPKGVGVFPTGIQSATFNGCRCESGGKTTYAYRDTNMRMFDSFDAWADDTCGKLRAWGFNMLGHGSSLTNRGFIEAPTAALGYSFWHDSPDDADRRIGEKWPLVFPNVFHPDFARHCREFAGRVCAPRKDDPWILGWFIDNEVSWRGMARGKVREDYATGLFDTVAALPKTHSARKALDGFLAARGAAEPDRAVKVAFLEFTAERYFAATTEAIRAADPNHLVLGCRFIQLMELEVWPTCARWCDAISVNLYPWVDLDRGTLHASHHETDRPLSERLDECGRLTGGKPLLVTEWSYLALDSGLPCTSGSGQRFYTQKERADAAVVFARTMCAHPLVAGWTFFRWVDQPKAGIAANFSENGNYGLVSEEGKVYPIASALGSVQRNIAQLRNSPPPAPDAPPASEIRRRHVQEMYAEIAARAGGNCAVSVRSEGARLLVDNGAGLELELAIGEGTALRNIRFQGLDMGNLLYTRQEAAPDGALKWRPRWRVGRIAHERMEGGAVRLKVDDLAFTVFPGVAEILCEGPEGARFEMRMPWKAERRDERPPHWNLWRPIRTAAWISEDGRTAEMRFRAPDVTVARFRLGEPLASASGFGGAKVTKTAEGVDVESAIGAPWSGVSLNFAKPVDISRKSSAVVSVTNLSPHPLALVVGMVDGAKRRRVCRDECMLEPYGAAEFTCGVLRKTREIPVALEGMLGYRETDRAEEFAPSNLVSVTVYRRRVDAKATFRVTSVRFGGCAQTISEGTSSAQDFFPFCDRFGQYRHAEWPGKVHAESDLAANRDEESRWLEAHSTSPIRGADAYGGWADGPQLAATGMFRVEKVDGKWWLVDPDGHLFFSHGIAGVRSGDGSPLTETRRRYFEWLPPDAKKDVSFQAINLVRKYGNDPDGAIERDVTRRRLRAWGVNTIGNWSSSNIWMGARIPYTDNFATKARPIKGLKLAGNRMPDVFAPEFAKNLATASAAAAARSGRDPWCIGWFVDNELSWGMDSDELARTVLAAPESQPARKAFVKRLEAQGKTVADALANEDALASLTRFFAETYFHAVRAAISKAAPGRLYLGCRFCSSRMNPVVLAVASDCCDVISANIYRLKPTACAMMSKWGVDKPHIVGEFHFGALDRGMMHASLIPTRDQADRAAHYRAYVRDALACDRIVGAHWFLYRDQALTGRKDGECLQCGFVDVADSPYPEMVEACRSIAGTLYQRRSH